MLIQTEMFGTSVARALRVHSDGMRTKRMQRAEEKAAMVSVKMTIPLILCILPSLIAVVMGPAIVDDRAADRGRAMRRRAVASRWLAVAALQLGALRVAAGAHAQRRHASRRARSSRASSCRRGDWAAAFAYADDLHRERPDDAEVLLLRGTIYRERGLSARGRGRPAGVALEQRLAPRRTPRWASSTTSRCARAGRAAAPRGRQARAQHPAT